jgi:hypothetical protein
MPISSKVSDTLELIGTQQMEKIHMLIIALLVILFLGQVIYQETFVDASDNSGTTIQLSLTDLLSLIGASSQSQQPATQPPVIITQPTGAGSSGGIDSQFYASLKDSITSDVRQAVNDQLLQSGGGLLGQTVLNDDCIDSVANQQGADWMRYIPGKNPADYVRKDSIPCYGCNLK